MITMRLQIDYRAPCSLFLLSQVQELLSSGINTVRHGHYGVLYVFLFHRFCIERILKLRI